MTLSLAKRPPANQAGPGMSGPTSGGHGSLRTSAGHSTAVPSQQQQRPNSGESSSQQSSPSSASTNNTSSGTQGAATVAGAALNTELRAKVRRERELGKATQTLRQRSASVVSSSMHNSEATGRRISPKHSFTKGGSKPTTSAGHVVGATNAGLATIPSSRSGSNLQHEQRSNEDLFEANSGKNASGTAKPSGGNSHGNGNGGAHSVHSSLQVKAASHPQLSANASQDAQNDQVASAMQTSRTAYQPEKAQPPMASHLHHDELASPPPPLSRPKSRNEEQVSNRAVDLNVEMIKAAYAEKIHELALKCRNWEKYAAKLLAQSEALTVENDMLKSLQSGQEQQIAALEIENRTLREERARSFTSGEVARASSRLGSRNHRPAQSQSAGELADHYARGRNSSAGGRILNLGLADISVPSPPRFAGGNDHVFSGPACSSNLYIDDRNDEDAHSDMRAPTPVSMLSLPYQSREQDEQMHTITKHHYTQHRHYHQQQQSHDVAQHVPHQRVPSNKSSSHSLNDHKSHNEESATIGRVAQLAQIGRTSSEPIFLSDVHGRFVQQQQHHHHLQQQHQNTHLQHYHAHHPTHLRRESHIYDIVGQDALARDAAELYAEGQSRSQMGHQSRSLIECQTQTDDAATSNAPRISTSTTFPPSAYNQGHALTKQALAAFAKPADALLGLGLQSASTTSQRPQHGERSVSMKSSMSPVSDAQRKSSGESLGVQKRRKSSEEQPKEEQERDSNHYAALRALEGKVQTRSGSSHSDAKTVTEEYLHGAVEQRRQLRRTSLSQQQQLMYLQTQAHQAGATTIASSQSESNIPFTRPSSRPGSRMSNHSGVNFESRNRSRNRSRTGSSSVHDIIPVAVDDVFSDALPSSVSGNLADLAANGNNRPQQQQQQQPLSTSSSAQNMKHNISSSSSFNSLVGSTGGTEDEDEENRAPRTSSMMNDLRPKSPTPSETNAFHLHGKRQIAETYEHSDAPSTREGYSTDIETMSGLHTTPSDEDEKRGAHRRLYMKLRDELNAAELTKFEKYVHRYDALEIPLHGGRGLLNRVKKLLLVSNPELRTGALDVKKRKELAREFERIVRADERTSST